MKSIRPLIFASFLVAQGFSQAAYQIQPGDTLTEIAESKYGNWVKWQDLWNVNRDHISDPNLIFPGQTLNLLTEEQAQFLASNRTGTTLSANDASPSTRTSRNRSKKSQEWRLLPLQDWEKYVFKLDPAIDPDGFDRRSRVAVRVADKAAADVTIASDRIPVLGEIMNARSEFERVFLGEQIFVRADEQLQVGTTYSITTGPQKLVSPRDARVGFAYDLTGKVRIIGVRDGLFIATVTALYHPIQRHQLLIPEVQSYTFKKAIPAPSALSAVVLTPQAAREDMLSEQKIVFIDAGTAEGVAPGMVFRHYLHTDPGTNEIITAKDFMIETELEVLTALDKFSVAIILKSRSIAHYGDDLVALTDLKDFERNQGLQSLIQDSQTKPSVDDLDQMDNTDGLGEKENHDLRQLEKWTKPTPDSAPSSEGSNDEVQRIDANEQNSRSTEIGKEVAPDDGSGVKPETMPEAPPATAGEPQVVPPADPNAPPPPQEDSLGPSIQTAPQDAQPPAIQDSNPLPTADPFATPAPQ